MSILLWEKHENRRWGSTGAAMGPGGVCCTLCGGTLYPGDPYFSLEGSRVCEGCIERYAKGYFAHRVRRVEYWEEEGHDDL